MVKQLYLGRQSLPYVLMSSVIALTGALKSQTGLADELDSKPSSTETHENKSKNAADPKPEDVLEEVLITGSKINLMSAQEMKRNAATMVDAISADQIGLLPDRSSLDAMQRIPGVAIERFASPNDPDHFSIEGSDIILRGMAQTRSEFNGRDSFSASAGRGLSYRDVPPELLGSIQIFKNQTADMIEGGIGGTINLITRKPFDSDAQTIAVSISSSYGDLAETWAPSFSGLYSDTFDTEFGRWGVLLNYVDTRLVGQSHGIQSETYMPFYAEDLVSPNDPNPVGHRAEDFVGEDGNGEVWAPNAANALMKEDDRKRNGLAAALQFANADDSVQVLFEYIRSDSTLAWNERSLKYQGGFFTQAYRPTAPLAGTHFLFDENGLFESGILVEEGNTWRTGATGRSRIPTDGDDYQNFRQFGHKTQADSRVNEGRSLIEDFSLNLTWQVNENFDVSGDLQYIQATAAVDDLSVHLATRAIYQYDVRGARPHLTLMEPWNGVRDADRASGNDQWDAMVDGQPKFPGFGGDPSGDGNYFQDDDSYLWSSAMDHYERSNGDSLALKLDSSYQLNFGPVEKIKVGYRFAEREQVVRATSWNWGALAPEWVGHPVSSSNWDLPEGTYEGKGVGWLPDIPQLQDGYERVDWSNFMGGGVLDLPGNYTLHANEKLIRAVMGANPSRHLYYSPLNDGNWEPYPERENVDSKFGIFAPDEINTTLETRNALYMQLDFSGDGELKYSGNIGIRYVTLERQALGVVDYPLMAPMVRTTQNAPPAEVELPLTPNVVDAYLNSQVADGVYPSYAIATTALETNWIFNPYYYLENDIRGFAQGTPVYNEDGTIKVERNRPVFMANTESLVAKDDYHTFLPSFNIKVDLTSHLVGRFAFAKSIAFPDMYDVRNRTEFESVEVNTEESENVDIIYRQVDAGPDSSISMFESVKLRIPENGANFVGEGGNPFMKPMESVQYDFSLEWYFSDYGQLSAAIFHKNLSNYFARGIYYRDFTNSMTGVTQQVAITSNRNGGDAKLDGLEINYNQFFDGWFEGFGVQATYTYVDANSVPNNEKDVEDERWFESIYEDTGIRVDPSKLPLQGQSDHIVNLIGLYENEKWSGRLAYNWRSKYLLTTRDVISKAPLWYDSHGELDGSLFYSISDKISIGVQAKNITNAQSDIIMILNDDMLETGRSWFVTDRRISLVLRGEL